MRKEFLITIMLVVLNLMGCSEVSNHKTEKCDFYLAYEYAYKPKDLYSTDNIPKIYGFEIKVNGDERKIIFKYADGHKEEAKVKTYLTTSMLSDMSEKDIIESFGTDYLPRIASLKNSNVIILVLDNGNSLHIDLDGFNCDYYIGSVRIKYPWDERRCLINATSDNPFE